MRSSLSLFTQSSTGKSFLSFSLTTPIHEKGPKGPKLQKAQKKVSYIYAHHTPEELERVNKVGNFPFKPSNLFLKVYSDVLRSVDSNPKSNMVAHDLIATSGVIPLTINAPFDTLFMHYYDCIVQAETEILIAAGFWKPGKVVGIITSALRELNSRVAARGGAKVVVKILWGKGTFRYQRKNSVKEQTKLNLPAPHEVPHLSVETMNVHKALFGVFHVKYMIVDRKYMLLTSANMQDKPNVEFMVHMDGKVVDSFYEMYKRQWGKVFEPALPLSKAAAPARSGVPVSQSPVRGPCIYHSEHSAVPMFLANRLPGGNFGHSTWDAPQNVAWLSAMHHAQRSIFIETPDFNASLAVDAVVDACLRGVSVTIVVSWVYNYLREKIFLQGGTNVHVMKKLYKKLTKHGCQQNLTVCFYVDRNQTTPTKVHSNHTKFMAIDEEVAIFGSGNMDTQSWHHSQEVNVVVASPLLVKEWMDLFKKSQNSHLYGVIDPKLPATPKEQIDKLLAKQHTQPHLTASPPPIVLNNSDAMIKAEDTYVVDGKRYNNFKSYYNTFSGIYSPPDGENASTQTSTRGNNTSITDSNFFVDPSLAPSSYRPSSLCLINRGDSEDELELPPELPLHEDGLELPTEEDMTIGGEFDGMDGIKEETTTLSAEENGMIGSKQEMIGSKEEFGRMQETIGMVGRAAH